jgi:glucose uptake protein
MVPCLPRKGPIIGNKPMLLPETYQTALFLMVLSMLCWGSWANTLKLCPGYRFQLFYWDYAIGLLLATVIWGLTAGSLGHTGPFFFDAVAQTQLHAILFALCGGVVFNIANLLLVAAIDVAGLAVAFPVGIGLALVIGAVSNFVASVAHLAKPIGPAVSYSIGQGATMISACWGVFVWREFAGAPRGAKLLLLFMFIFFLLGLGAIALAPLY